MLLDACNHNGLITEDGQKSVMASIRSGIRNGKTRPRTVPESNGQDHESREDDVPADDPYQDQGPSVVISLCPAVASSSTPTRRQFHYGVKMIKSGGPMARA
jgi:hypothetical protein